MTVIDFAEERKIAAEYYKTQDYGKALKCYLSLLENTEYGGLNHISDEDKSILYSNASQCCLSMEEWEKAKELSTKSLGLNPGNVKALFRRSTACERLHSYEEALKDMRRLQFLEPNNKQFLDRFEALSKKLYEQKECRLAKKLPETVLESFKTSLCEFIQLDTHEPRKALLKSLPSSTICFLIDDALLVLRGRMINKESSVSTVLKDIGPYLIAVVSCAISLYNDMRSKTDHETSREGKLASMSDWQHLQNIFFLGILMQVLRTLHCCCASLYPGDASSGNDCTPTDCLSSHDATLSSLTPKTKKLEITQKDLATSFTPQMILEIVKHCIWLGVGTNHFADQRINLKELFLESSEGVEVALRTSCVLFALRFLRLNHSTRSTYCFETLCCAVSAHESSPIIQCALETAGCLLDIQRQQGSRVLHLIKTQELMKFLESVIQLMADPNDNPFLTNAHFVLSTTFCLLADKDRPAEDNVCLQELASLLLSSYLDCCAPTRDDAEKNLLGLKVVMLLSRADRNVAKSFLLEHHYLETLLIPRLVDPVLQCSELKAQVLVVILFCLEFRDLRSTFLEMNGLSITENLLKQSPKCDQDWIDQLQIILIAVRLCIHEKKTSDEIFQRFDLLTLAAKTVMYLISSVSGKSPQLLQTFNRSIFEIFFFLSLHGKFKEALLNKKKIQNDTSGEEDLLDKFIQAAEFPIKEQDTVCCLLYLQALCNLLQSRDSKERPTQRQRKPGDLQLDDDQLEALKEFYDKLPEHCKPSSSSGFEYDRGSNELKEKFHGRLIKSNVMKQLCQICLWPSPQKSSFQLLSSCINVLSFLFENQSTRSDVCKSGCLSALLHVATVLRGEKVTAHQEDLERCRQVIAQISMVINPATLSYKETMSTLSHLFPLLSHSYELYQYEASLAITNLISHSSEARNSLFFQKGIPIIVNVAVSDNPLCRAAGLEMLCNMALCEPFREQIAKGQYQVDLQLLLAFLMEQENERAQSASAGCLAMLSSDPEICERLLECPNVTNLNKLVSLESSWMSNENLQHRILVIVLNFTQLSHLSFPSKEEANTEVCPAKVSEGFFKFQRQLVQDLIHSWSPFLPSLSEKVQRLFTDIQETQKLCSNL